MTALLGTAYSMNQASYDGSSQLTGHEGSARLS